MKKSIFNKFKTLALAASVASVLVASMALTSCHDNIYGLILEEVPLESFGISGHVQNIVRYNCDGEESLFLTNGRVYKRTAAPSTASETTWNKNWVKVFDPLNNKDFGTMIAYLASDSNYLYALSSSFKVSNIGNNIEDKRHLLCSTDGENWTEIDVSSLLDESLYDSDDSQYDISVLAIDIIFCNNNVNSASRNAYVRLNDKTVYKLNGTSAPTPVSSNNAGSKTCSVTSYNGSDYFNDSYTFASNDKYMFFTNNGKILYYADSWSQDKGYYLAGNIPEGSTAEQPFKITPGTGNIYSVATTADFVILGTVSGIYHIELDSVTGVPATTTASFTTNAKTIFSSTYQVHPILVLDPTAAETETDIYAASSIKGSYSTTTHGLFDDTGLYAYYPARGYWNKDGTANKTAQGN